MIICYRLLFGYHWSSNYRDAAGESGKWEEGGMGIIHDGL